MIKKDDLIIKNNLAEEIDTTYDLPPTLTFSLVSLLPHLAKVLPY